MFCTNCGSELKEGSKYCSSCGNEIEGKSKTLNHTNIQEPVQLPSDGRGNLILILGILSIILLGFITGIPAWVMGNNDLKLIEKGLIPKFEKGATKTGMILGIIGTIVSTTFILSAIFTGISVFNSASIAVESVESNRKALIADCQTLASIGQQHYRKPTSMGGGGNSFWGYNFPKMKSPNGKYSREVISADLLRIIAIGNKIGDDGINPTRIEFLVYPNDFEIEIIN
ncbi:MAG: zinc ribbon domain-containing protein [Melioribacteraceae bacterium]|nr:zinc ribbon domain-containing protein [Melioribacteraceae bacterium]